LPVATTRYLTKSRFTLAVECPTKLYYTGKKHYANTKLDDEFLAALAEGGFQVGELAKVMHPGGVEVTPVGNADALAQTAQLLQAHTITLYEAAIAHGPFLVRVDVLRKVGNEVDLIEVKAKSFDSRDPHTFRLKRGGIDKSMLPYLQDVAFQRYVLGLAHPEWAVRSFLMMADKSKVATVSGLNQRFRIQRSAQSRQRVIVKPGTTVETIGESVLSAVCVDEYVADLLRAPLGAAGSTKTLGELATHWAQHYAADRKIRPDVAGRCAKCEFRSDETQGLASGFHECWQEAKGWTREVLDQGTVLDIWNFRRRDDLIGQGVIRFSDVRQEDIRVKEGESGLSPSQRQWMQVSGRWPGGGDFYLDRDLMRAEMATWTYPLHFIDFETARVALPFYVGQGPYANIAFQFSHHKIDREGTVSHANEYLSLERGVSPNYEFARQLSQAVGSAGTIFMWTPHENTTLRAILEELDSDPHPPADANELRAFLLDITRETGVREGRRAMYDLCDLAKRAFFHPATKASSSLKKVLPAVLASSGHLRDRYQRPIYGALGGIPSKNFQDWAWWRPGLTGPVNPYELLPPVFSDIPQELLNDLESDEDMQLAEGGAATTAWARTQFEETDNLEVDRIRAALLRYCELDTLAMVMVFEAWREWLGLE
jgi:Domain of unknown function(DUF2779)